MRQQWWWSWREGSDGDKSQCGRSVLPALPKSKEEKPNLSCVSVITNTEKRVSSCRRLSSTLVSSLDQYSLFHQRAQGSDFALCTTLCSKLWKPVLKRSLCWDTDNGYGEDLMSGVFCNILITQILLYRMQQMKPPYQSAKNNININSDCLQTQSWRMRLKKWRGRRMSLLE